METAVLTSSARRCALCFHLNGDLGEKPGQIAHLDGDRSNSAEDNLAYMCLDHHSLFDSKTKQHKNYTVQEVKAARAELYQFVLGGKHLSPAAAQPYLQAEADKRVLRDFMKRVPSSGSIRFLRSHDFAGPFEEVRLEDVMTFSHGCDGPEHEFLDPQLESGRQGFRKFCDKFLLLIATNTFPIRSAGFQSVPKEWSLEQPKRFKETVDEIHGAADAVCKSYDELVRLARRKLAV